MTIIGKLLRTMQRPRPLCQRRFAYQGKAFPKPQPFCRWQKYSSSTNSLLNRRIFHLIAPRGIADIICPKLYRRGFCSQTQNRDYNTISAPDLASERIVLEEICEQHDLFIAILSDPVNNRSLFRNSPANSYSEMLYGQYCPALEKVLVGWLRLHYLMLGKAYYPFFTRGQAEKERISKDEFICLSNQINAILGSNYDHLSRDTLEALLQKLIILFQISESPTACSFLSTHLKISVERLQGHRQILEIFCNKDFSFLMECFKIKERYILLYLARQPSFPGMLLPNSQENGEERFDQGIFLPFSLGFLVDILRTSRKGAFFNIGIANANINLKSEVLFRCAALKNADGSFSYSIVRNNYFPFYAKLLDLDLKTPKGQVLFNIALFLGLDKKEQVAFLKAIFTNSLQNQQVPQELMLSEEEKRKIFATWNSNRPFLAQSDYLPEFLRSLLENTNLGETWEKRLAQTVAKGVVFAAEAFNEYAQREFPETAFVHRICFRSLVEIAQESPQDLLSSEFQLDQRAVIKPLPNNIRK